ncbi:MAG: PDZ domain-containing protein [Byssovorax sp.]
MSTIPTPPDATPRPEPPVGSGEEPDLLGEEDVAPNGFPGVFEPIPRQMNSPSGAGVSPDDVIVAFDGKPIEDPNELRWLASIAGVNKVTTVRVARSDRTFDLRVTLGELADQGDSDDDR